MPCSIPCAAADLLEANPEAIFTCGEAWKYRQVQVIDPSLFERIRKLVAKGQWEIVGWWIQPDCNGPSDWAMRKQIELGCEYFRRRSM